MTSCRWMLIPLSLPEAPCFLSWLGGKVTEQGTWGGQGELGGSGRMDAGEEKCTDPPWAVQVPVASVGLPSPCPWPEHAAGYPCPELVPLQTSFPAATGGRVCSACCFLWDANCSDQKLAKTDACKENTCPDLPQQLGPCLGLASSQRMLLQCLENTQKARDFPGVCCCSRGWDWAKKVAGLCAGLQSSPGPDWFVLGTTGGLSPPPSTSLAFVPRALQDQVDWGGWPGLG